MVTPQTTTRQSERHPWLLARGPRASQVAGQGFLAKAVGVQTPHQDLGVSRTGQVSNQIRTPRANLSNATQGHHGKMMDDFTKGNVRRGRLPVHLVYWDTTSPNFHIARQVVRISQQVKPKTRQSRLSLPPASTRSFLCPLPIVPNTHSAPLTPSLPDEGVLEIETPKKGKAIINVKPADDFTPLLQSEKRTPRVVGMEVPEVMGMTLPFSTPG